jgi:hypothetical protein
MHGLMNDIAGASKVEVDFIDRKYDKDADSWMF